MKISKLKTAEQLSRLVLSFTITILVFCAAKGSCSEIMSNEKVWKDTTDMDVSTIWYSTSFASMAAPDGDCGLQIDMIKVVRDTLIGEKLARVVGHYKGGNYLPESEVVLYSKENKVYFHEDDEWKLLYDFGAEVGDTVTYYISKKYSFYNIPYDYDDYEQYIIDQNPYRLVIKNIDTIYTSLGVALKRFTTENEYNMGAHSMGTIIEKVGSEHKLFGSNGNFIPPECLRNFPRLRCYSDEDVSVNLVNEQCDTLVSVSDLALYGITIYPNPGLDKLSIKMARGEGFKLTITNVDGAIVFKEQLEFATEISTIDWPSGIYYIQFIDKHGNHATYKWVKL